MSDANDDPNDVPVSVSVRRRHDGESEHDEPSLKKRLALVVPLLMAAAAIAGFVLVGMQDKGIYSKPVKDLVEQKAKFAGKAVRAEGTLVHGSLVKQESPCEYRFRIAGGGAELPVKYAKCIVPDTFRDVAGTDVSVTVEGELRPDGSFEATQVLAKCPSKYEMKQRAASGEQAPHAVVP